MQASTNVRPTPLGRRAGHRRSGMLLTAFAAALLVSLSALFLEGGAPAQAIVGGDTANHNPGIVALVYRWDATDPDPTNPDPNVNPYGPNPKCGGALIDSNSVLTAAHCLYAGNGQRLNLGYLEVIAGATKLFAGKGVVRDVTEMHVHDLYQAGPGWPYNDQKYDVAVLTLNQPAPNPKELYLATEADDHLEKKGEKAVVAGWGYTKKCTNTQTGCRPEEQLRWVRVPLWSDQDAKLVHPLVGKFTFHPNHMVAAGGEQGRGHCEGDSGGPLFAENKTYTRGTIIGIASFGPCGESSGLWQNPDVYTEVNNPSIRTFITAAASK